jgi:hypothetical protein
VEVFEAASARDSDMLIEKELSNTPLRNGNKAIDIQ